MDKPGFWSFFISQFRLWEDLDRPIRSDRYGKVHFYREVRKKKAVWRGWFIASSFTPFIAVIFFAFGYNWNYIFDLLLAFYLLLFLLLSLRYVFIRFEKISDEYIPTVLKVVQKKRVGNIIVMSITLAGVAFMLMNSWSALYLRSLMDDAAGRGCQFSVRMMAYPDDVHLEPGRVQLSGAVPSFLISACRSPDTLQVVLNYQPVKPLIFDRRIKFIWDPDYFLQNSYFLTDPEVLKKVNTLDAVCGKARQTFIFRMAEGK